MFLGRRLGALMIPCATLVTASSWAVEVPFGPQQPVSAEFQLPGTPSNPVPSHGATGIAVGTTLPLTTGFFGCVVVPASNETVEGNSDNGAPFNLGFFTISSMRYQQIYDSPAFPAAGGVITQIRFRPDGTQGVGFPFGPTAASCEIYLGLAATSVAAPSDVFANNIGAGYTQVFEGALTLSSAADGLFDIVVDIEDVFTYDPVDGPLLMDVFMFGDPLTTQFDAAGDDGSVPPTQTETTRIRSVSAGSVHDTTGDTGLGGDSGFNDPYGLVTMFCFGGATPEPTTAATDWSTYR